MKTKKLKSSLASLASLAKSTIHFLGPYVPHIGPRSTRWTSVAGLVGVGALLGAGVVISLAPGTIGRVASTLSNGDKRGVGAIEILSADPLHTADSSTASPPTPAEKLDGVHNNVIDLPGTNGPLRS